MSRRNQQQKKGQNNKTKKTDNKKGNRSPKKSVKKAEVSADDLDRQLRMYMGEDVKKQDLDDQLSAYFKKADEANEA